MTMRRGNYGYSDENSNLTKYSYLDPWNRLTAAYYPDGGQKLVTYDDAGPEPTISTSTQMNSSGETETSKTTTDGVGHVIQTQLTSDPSGSDTVNTTYDGSGRVYTRTNPFRGSTPPAGTTTTYYYDALGEPIETLEQDGNKVQSCYNGIVSSPAVANCSSRLGSVTTGTWVDTTDENGNHWQHISDSFGRMTNVMEPNGTSQSPTMETDYTYNALNDLTGVTQWGGAKGSSGASIAILCLRQPLATADSVKS